MKLKDHPTVRHFHRRPATEAPQPEEPLDAAWLRQLLLGAGADDVGFVEIGRSALDDQRDDILEAFPRTKTLIGYLRGEKNIVWAILRRRVRLKGPLKLLLAFAKCFPR